jgi:hypothetical protein
MERLLRHWRYLLGAVILLSLVAAATDAFHRTPWSDEGWFSSASYNLARHGFLGTTVIETAGSGLTRIDQRTYWVMPLFLLGQALWLKLVPATLFTARLFTLFWHPVALWSLYAFLARLFPAARAVPALAAGLLACSFHFIDNPARSGLRGAGAGGAGFVRPFSGAESAAGDAGGQRLHCRQWHDASQRYFSCAGAGHVDAVVRRAADVALAGDPVGGGAVSGDGGGLGLLYFARL